MPLSPLTTPERLHYVSMKAMWLGYSSLCWGRMVVPHGTADYHAFPCMSDWTGPILTGFSTLPPISLELREIPFNDVAL